VSGTAPQFISIYNANEFPDIYRMLVDEGRSATHVYSWLRKHRGVTGSKRIPGITKKLLVDFQELVSQNTTADAAKAYVLAKRDLAIEARVGDIEALDFVIKAATESVIFDPNTEYMLSDFFKALEVKARLLNSAGFLSLISKVGQDGSQLHGIVDAVTFAEDPYFCGLQLFPWQREALYKFFQPQYGYNELVAIMGMGSGKGVLGAIIAWYCAYLLVTLEDPQAYWGFAPGQEIIACLNMATSEDQAKDAVFKHIKDRAEQGGPWFSTSGLVLSIQAMRIELCKNIVIKCGHSRATQLVGGTVFCVVFDEISRYKDTSGKDNAEDVYNKLRGSTKRFGMQARSVEISSPEWEGDLGMRLLKQAESGEFPRMLPVHMATWEANPLIPYESLKDDFRRSPRNAQRDFGADPPTALEAFFRNRRLLEASPTVRDHPLNEDGTFKPSFIPCCKAPRYVHVDLAKNRDSCGLVVVHSPTAQCAHHERLVGASRLNDMGFDTKTEKDLATSVYVDLAIRFTAGEDDIDFARVRQIIFDLQSMGFDFRMGGVTYDRWQSADSIQQMRKRDIPAEILSVDRTTGPYDTLQELLIWGGLDWYNLTWDAVPPAPTSILEELLQLQLVDGRKVDHMSFGCFTGDTRVALLDGTNPTFEELVERYGDGSDFYVYSIDENKELTVGVASKPRITRRNVDIVEVELDQGKHIRCTPDHLFMLRDGTYRRADELQVEDSLMSMSLNAMANQLGCGNGTIVNRVLWEGFESQVKSGKPGNHIVLSVTPAGKADVYDFEVAEHHNFALTAGVFVHNSKDVSDALAGACFSCVEGQRRKGSNIDLLANVRRLEEFWDD